MNININEEELLSKAQNGDAESVSVLMEKYKNLVKSIARSFYFNSVEEDDLIQEGMLGLYSAISTFNKKASFKNYAIICIKRRILNAIKLSSANKNKPFNQYFSISIDCENNKEITFSKVVDPEIDLIKQEEESELKCKIKDLLSNFEYDVLSMFLNGYSYVEIGKELNKNIKTVDNALQRARKKIYSVIK